MDRIAHIAFKVTDVEQTANFYKEVFGLHEVRRVQGPGRFDDPRETHLHRLYLSDGFTNVAIRMVGSRELQKVGLAHFGFLVDDLNETRKRVEAAGYSMINKPGGRSLSESLKFIGPAGVLVDISQRGYPI